MIDKKISQTTVPPASGNNARLGIALAGGGSWGAFTYGALQALIEAGIINEQNIEAISGTSAGAAHTAILSHAANSGRIAKANSLMDTFWNKVVAHGEQAGFNIIPTSLGEKFPNLNPGILEQGKQTMRLMQAWGLASQPGTIESKIESVIGRDWSAIHNGKIKTYIGTARASNGPGGQTYLQHKTFSNKEITPKVIAASGTLVGTTRISNDYYVDGAYLKNPSMAELNTAGVSDILAIVLSPQPKGSITARNENDITPGPSGFVGKEVYQHLAWLSQNSGKRVHVIDMPHEAHWNETSKMNISREWIDHLHRLGYARTKRWIAENAHKIGKESSFTPVMTSPAQTTFQTTAHPLKDREIA